MDATRDRVALVVDDDPDVSFACTLHLEAAGFRVRQAGTGQQAVDEASADPPSVILLDYMLPDFDGLEVLRRLGQGKRTADVPVVMLTARTDEGDQRAAWEAGVTDFLTKPFDGGRLVAAVTGAATGTAPEATRRRRDALARLQDVGRERDEVLAAILDSAQDAVILATTKGEITYWNKGAEDLLGWHADEAIGSKVDMLTVPGAEDEIRRVLAKVEAGERPASFETTRLHRDGHRLIVSVTVSPVFGPDGHLFGVSAIVRDGGPRRLRESWFRGLVEAAPDAMVIVDGDGRIELVNRQTERLFGYPRDALVGSPVEMLVPERFRGRHPQFRRAYTDRPRTREMGAGLELFALRADGTEFPVEISLSPLESEHGTSYAATLRDVTDRRSAEAKFRGLLEAAPDAIVGVDKSGTIVLVNRQTERLFGYPREELLGQQVELLVPESLRRDHPAYRQQYFAEPRTRTMGAGLDLVARRKDGTEFPAEISLSSIQTEDGLLVSAAIRDVTERKHAEARFRGLVEAAPDAMVIVNADGRIQLVNQQTLRMFGYERGDLVDQPVEVLVPQRFRDQHPRHRRAYAQTPRFRPMGQGLELAGLRKDGSEFPVEISLSPLDTDQGVTISASIRDVSKRKQAEDAQTLAFEREREATARLREVDRLRSDFLSTVSHELRTPLTSINAFAEWLVNSWESTPDDRKRDIVNRILHAGGRLDELIQDLLDFSRLERGQVQVDVGPQTLAPLVQETISHASASLQGHPLDVEIGTEILVLADASALRRVLGNLLTNASKFSPDGAPIHVVAEMGPDEVVLTVRDEGMGIPLAEQDKVFDRFYRVPATAAHYPGTGIGLAIVKQFTEAQGGRVMVSSPPGEGSAFSVYLPRPRAGTTTQDGP